MNTQQRKKTAGFTMIEMLVALLILSVGLLGIAALQTTGQQATYRAYVRTQATWLAYDIMDRMRINQANAANYIVSDFASAGPGGGNPNNQCDEGTCDPEQLAVYDLDNWFIQIQNSLPMGEARIISDLAIANQYNITLRWLDRQQDEDGELIEQDWVLRL